ncbi:cytochrome b/b6 domain-containing protein [Sphingobium boeckii]|uniref:Cytochrome b n=1 Tax=Sphingobium boeckii TaxID=1082345 RepID=A0A7W9AER3_9SPHN|nr:cytochrome b/b6 domain-containing protein [Sphingobium boeckii]MBB5684340.1 cytochrome b [Sphingobium boeckii]
MPGIAPQDAATPAMVTLWDLPVRLVHWSFVALIPALWWTGEEGDIDTHKTIGFVMIGLVLFRILWGVVGSGTARFANFVRGPRAIIAHLRGSDGEGQGPVIGHNPLGALSVIALLVVLVTQLTLGLFAQDVDGIESGPLAYLISYDGADAAREWHELGFNILLGLIVVHLAAIAYYVIFKRDNLIGPMVTGRKRMDGVTVRPAMAPAWRSMIAAAIAAGAAWWISLGAPLPGIG